MTGGVEEWVLTNKPIILSADQLQLNLTVIK